MDELDQLRQHCMGLEDDNGRLRGKVEALEEEVRALRLCSLARLRSVVGRGGAQCWRDLTFRAPSPYSHTHCYPRKQLSRLHGHVGDLRFTRHEESLEAMVVRKEKAELTVRRR